MSEVLSAEQAKAKVLGWDSEAEIWGLGHGKVYVHSPRLGGQLGDIGYLGTSEARRVAAWISAASSLPEKEDGEVLEALKRAAILVRLVTVRQVVDSGMDAINAAGLNPYCLNEGRANGDEPIGTWWLQSAIEKAEAKQ